MAMSKKDFIALAEYLSTASLGTHCSVETSCGSPGCAWEGDAVSVEDLREHLANFCHSRNPKFNRQRWLGYIRGENGPNGGRTASQDAAQTSTLPLRSDSQPSGEGQGHKPSRNRSWGDYYANSDPDVVEHDEFISDFQGGE